METYLNGLIGGVMIGTAAMLLMMSIGRIAGISGIFFNGLKSPNSNIWALLFVAGLILGTGLVQAFSSTPAPEVSSPLPLIIIGGLIVGFGVKLGSGCTSGHGICGIGRLSTRSIVATVTFMASGILTVFVRLHLL